MHFNLITTLVEFFDSLSQEAAYLNSISDTELSLQQKHAVAVYDVLEDVANYGRAYTEELSQYSATASGERQPEKVRSAATNLVRAVEMFKKRYTAFKPASSVRNHPKVGCLYGYAEPRTATLDKAALVAQENMIDIWTLTESDLQSLAGQTRTQSEALTQSVKTLSQLCVCNEGLEAVA